MYSNYHHSQPQVGPDAGELLRRLDDGFDDGAEYSSSSDESLEEDLTVSPDDAFWCRGRCNGALDTPFCTQQCIREWEPVWKSTSELGYRMDLRESPHRPH